MKKSLLFRNGDSSFCKIYLLVCLLLVGFINLNAQEAPNKKVSLDLKNVPLIDVLLDIQKQTGVNFAYEKTQVEQFKPVTISIKGATVEEVLKIILKDTGFTYKITGNNIAIVKQQETSTVKLIQVSGKVTDEKGNSIPGATVIIHGTTQGVATDVDGRYTLAVKPDDVLRVSFVGYKPEVVPIKGKTKVNVALNPTAENIEEVQVVAFGTQKKESVVSAITTVRPMDLKSSSSDLTSSLAGRVAGIIGWQTGGMPGALTEEEMNTKFYVRGITSFNQNASSEPLILIDGVESSKLDLSRMAPEDIETFSVLKDASATAMYGARGANGIIVVTTKKGQEGSVYATARYEAVFSMPTKEIEVVDPITWMKMYNQALLTRNPNATPKYSVEQINRTASGKYPDWLYPANDWYDMMIKDYTLNHRFGLNIRGGSKILQYYASVNYNRDLGQQKTDKLNDFEVGIKSNSTTFRANLTINLKAGIQLLINSATTFDKYHGPMVGASSVYGMAFSASPVDFAAVYPADETYNWPHIRFGTTTAKQTNPYMQLHQGYQERSRYSTSNRFEYIQNFSSLVKGLELRAGVSISSEGYNATMFKTTPFLYSLAGYSEETGEHTLQAINPTEAVRTLSVGQKTNTASTQVVYDVSLYHTAAWKNHQTSLIGVFQMMEKKNDPVQSVLNGQPQRNMTFSMRGTYGFKDRYFIEGNFGYNGSERFADGERWGFFPAGGVSWIVSNEPFMQKASNWLSYLKVRASYGQVGNDAIGNEPRFAYLPSLGKRGSYRDPEPYGGMLEQYHVYYYANDNIKWEIAETVNFGLEGRLYNGLVEFNLDAFQEIRHNVLGYRQTIPSVAGVEYAPLDNIGKGRTRGIEFSGKVQHAFNNNFWMILNGNITYSRSSYLEIDEAVNKPEYQRMKGQESSQAIGYIAEGLFRDQAEIDNSPTQGGNVMPGDIRYRDLNGDGTITVEDATYIGFPETPRMIYGFMGMFNYKNWEFSFAFQGSGQRSFFMNPQSISPFVQDRAMLKAIYEDHWSENNMSDRPFWPRLSTFNITEHNPQENRTSGTEVRKSTYFMRECRFLRCTSLELAYNLPKELMNRWKLQNVKCFFRANNPFMFSSFDVWDVEMGSNGFNYPIQKTFTVGLNLSF